MSNQVERSKAYKNQAHKLLKKKFPTLSVAAAIGDATRRRAGLSQIMASHGATFGGSLSNSNTNFTTMTPTTTLSPSSMCLSSPDSLLFHHLAKTCRVLGGDLHSIVSIAMADMSTMTENSIKNDKDSPFTRCPCCGFSADEAPSRLWNNAPPDCAYFDTTTRETGLSPLFLPSIMRDDADDIIASAAVEEDQWVDGEVPMIESTTPMTSDTKNAAAGSSSNAELPYLPPEIWAMVITDLLPYEDVMNFSVVCTFFLRDVLPLVPRLFFSRPGELHAKQARRFENGCVKEIKIFCYITYEQYEDEDGSQRWRQKLCEKTARWADRFASCFPKLEALFVGGVRRGRRLVMNGRHMLEDRYNYEESESCYDIVRHGPYPYDMYRNWYTSDGVTTEDEETHRHLTRSFCSAFEYGDLRDSVEIHGVSGTYACCREHWSCNGMCRLVFETFPFYNLFILFRDERLHSCQTCLSVEDRLAIIAERPGGQEFLEGPDQLRRAPRLGIFSDGNGVFSLSEESFSLMRELVATYRGDPARVTFEQLVEWQPFRDRPFNAASFRELKAIGFRIPDGYFTNLVEMAGNEQAAEDNNVEEAEVDSDEDSEDEESVHE